jgi:hypothetical protein
MRLALTFLLLVFLNLFRAIDGQFDTKVDVIDVFLDIVYGCVICLLA